MSHSSLRERIAQEAARLLYQGRQSEYRLARRKAARTVARRWVNADELPTDEEIRQQLDQFAQLMAPNEVGSDEPDRFLLYRALLMPLEKLIPGSQYHPEGDLLYHSLQVFQLASDELPYDEEFLTAALLHDVGKGIDPYDHEQAAVDTLGAAITERTAWFIAHHTDGLQILSGAFGHRARRRLEESPDFEDLLRLAECDRKGRVPGRRVPDVDDALAQIEELSDLCG